MGLKEEYFTVMSLNRGFFQRLPGHFAHSSLVMMADLLEDGVVLRRKKVFWFFLIAGAFAE